MGILNITLLSLHWEMCKCSRKNDEFDHLFTTMLINRNMSNVETTIPIAEIFRRLKFCG